MIISGCPLLQIVAIAMLGAGTLSGCQPVQPTVGEPLNDPPVFENDGPTTWPFWPVAMSIHDLTRITIDRTENSPVLEARVEFADAGGATTKAFGQVLLELTEDVAFAETPQESEIWSIDLRDLRTNTTHFDDVTRTYLFKLRLDPARQWTRPRLRVHFRGADDAVLTDHTSVRPYVIEPAQAPAPQAEAPSVDADILESVQADALPER